MPDFGSPLAAVVVLLLIGVMLSFAFGTQRNIRIGSNHLRWLQSGLPRIGRRTTLRWLGSSAVQLDVVDPAEPFREATVLVVLEPRDVPLLWLFARARGRRDMLIVRTNLRRAPRLDLEAVHPEAWIRATDVEEADGWGSIDLGPGLTTTASGVVEPDTVAAARRAREGIAATGATVWRLSIRRVVPHLEIHLRPPSSWRGDADRVIEPITELAHELARA
jgi:hypothetical protein